MVKEAPVNATTDKLKGLMEKKVENKLGKSLKEFVKTKTQQITPQAMYRDEKEDQTC